MLESAEAHSDLIKWLVVAVALLGVFPLSSWIRQDNSRIRLIWTIIGMLPFVWGVFPRRKIVLLGVPDWPGFTQGFDVSLVDYFVVVGFLSLPRARGVALPFKISFGLYMTAVVLSAFQATNPTATLYYSWQLFRIFLVFAVVARACAHAELATAILKGLAIGVCVQGAIVGWQRFVIHYVQAMGTFSAQNVLGMSMHFVMYPFFALLLSGVRGWQPKTIPAIGFIIVIFTTSRASLGFAVIGLTAMTLFYAVVRPWTPQLTRVIASGVLVALLIIPLAVRQFEYRFSGLGVTEGDGGRGTLNDAARMVLEDHPLGTGANNFVVFANASGYYEKADVNRQNSTAYPHNIYWLTAAETGYFGIVAFVVFLLRPLSLALSYAWRYRSDPRGNLLFGLATTLAIVFLHSFFEKNFFYDQIQYLFALNLGLIAGLVNQIKSRSLGKAIDPGLHTRRELSSSSN